MNQFAIFLCLSSAVLVAAAPQGYNYKPSEPVQLQQIKQSLPLPVGNLRPQTPVSQSGIYSVSQAPALASFPQQQQQPIFAPAPGPVSLPAPLPQQTVVQQAPQLVQQQPQQQIIYQPQQPQQIIQQQPQYVQQPQVIHQQQQQQFQRPAIVTKDIYIHSAPDDTEDLSQGGPALDNVPVRKNYRIVFIKAPTQNLRHTAAALKRAQATNEEKTVIYVLSKKPDIAEIQQHLQASQGEAKVHKPEVYFIKYKTQEEAQRAQQEIQAQYDALGGATHISDEGVAPITSVSGGNLNIGSLVPHHIQSQIQTISQPVVHQQISQDLGGQQQTSFVQQQQSVFQSNSGSSGLNFGATLPIKKYLPPTKK